MPQLEAPPRSIVTATPLSSVVLPGCAGLTASALRISGRPAHIGLDSAGFTPALTLGGNCIVTREKLTPFFDRQSSTIAAYAAE